MKCWPQVVLLRKYVYVYTKEVAAQLPPLLVLTYMYLTVYLSSLPKSYQKLFYTIITCIEIFKIVRRNWKKNWKKTQQVVLKVFADIFGDSGVSYSVCIAIEYG